MPNIFPSDIEDDWPPADQSFFLYIHTDHLGSTNLVTEGQSQSTHNGIRFVAGEVVQRVEYMPFGKERYVLNPALKQGPKFTGQTQDEEDGLYFYKSRYYDPVLGRFIQPDALILADAGNPQTLNSYRYVLNNPLQYTDPTGQCFTDFDSHDEFDLGETERTEIDFLTGNEDRAMDRVKRDAERVDRVLEGEGTITDRDVVHAMGREGLFSASDVIGFLEQLTESSVHLDMGPFVKAALKGVGRTLGLLGAIGSIGGQGELI
ncbi:MAG: RHS repeat-associated core domain-containing protein, partial [Deltaproteobacteria bacterium]|nr:RHS repeat-associated core domain-containing protein [Deltaproteobacteria bacterium]